MLPTSKKEAANIKKYADTAIPAMIRDMINAGADQKRLISKIAGGATMFKHAEKSLWVISGAIISAVSKVHSPV